MMTRVWVAVQLEETTEFESEQVDHFDEVYENTSSSTHSTLSRSGVAQNGRLLLIAGGG